MEAEQLQIRTSDSDSDSPSPIKCSNVSPAPTFDVGAYKYPKVLHSQLDDELQELAQTIFSRQDEQLTNEISAPYEVPQFPIEQIEKKLAIQRQISCRFAKELGERHHESSEIPIAEEVVKEEFDFTPHYQRVTISGEDTSGVSTDVDVRTAIKI